MICLVLLFLLLEQLRGGVCYKNGHAFQRGIERGSHDRHDPVEMLLRTDHRPEVADDFGVVELGERGLGDHLQRFAGRIRQEVKMQAAHRVQAMPSREPGGKT